MVLGGFIKFNSSGAVYGQGLASGIDPTNIKNVENSAKNLLKANVKINVNNSPDQVLRKATIAKQMEDSNDLMQQVSELQVRGMRAGLERLKIGRQHRKQAMAVEADWQREMQGLTEDLLQYRMKTGLIQAESLGTQKAYKSSPLDAL